MIDFSLEPYRGRSKHMLIYWQLLSLSGLPPTGERRHQGGPTGLKLRDFIYRDLLKVAGLKEPYAKKSIGYPHGVSLRGKIYKDLLEISGMSYAKSEDVETHKKRRLEYAKKRSVELPDGYIIAALKYNKPELKDVVFSADMIQAKRLQLIGRRLWIKSGRPGKEAYRNEQRTRYSANYHRQRRLEGKPPYSKETQTPLARSIYYYLINHEKQSIALA